MRIGIFNVRYSPNLGDGILSLCLEGELRRLAPDAQIETHDIAGRTEYGENASKRKLALTVLDRLPAGLRQRCIEYLLGRVVQGTLLPRWREIAVGLDCALVGGGNLISDIDLNFPLKVNGLSVALSEASVPWSFTSVGVAERWTKRGTELFRGAIERHRPRYVSTRDVRSSEIWNERMVPVGFPRAEVCPDPAVLCFRHMPAPPRALRARPLLGINIIGEGEIALHAGGSRVPMMAWFSQLASMAIDAGFDLLLFTNGNLQDDETLRRMESEWTGGRDHVSFEPRPRTPAELLGWIGRCDVVVGHRLHLHIPAFSYRIPGVGLLWDKKLQSFFQSVGRDAYLLDAATATAADALAAIVETHAKGVDEAMWQRTVAAADEGFEKLLLLSCGAQVSKPTS